MNKQEIIVVVCRIIALWLVIHALSLLIFVLTQNVDIFCQHADEGVVQFSYVISTIVNFCLNIFIAYGLWMYSPRIYYWILPKTESCEENYPSLTDWLAILYVLLGVFWFVNILPPIVTYTQSVLIDLYFEKGFNNPSFITTMGRLIGPIAFILQLIIAIFLILKARWLAKIIVKFNGFKQVDEQ